MNRPSLASFVGLIATVALAAPAAFAGDADRSPGQRDSSRWSSLSISDRVPQPEEETGAMSEETEITIVESDSGYREISDFFNIREANANVGQGEWEFEWDVGWKTDSGGSDDDLDTTLSLRYGITNDLFVELGVLPINFGDGGNVGNGDLELLVFYQFLHEDGALPAMAAWASMRIPTGDGSSGVDGELAMSMTKSIDDNLRLHLAGFVETANGGRGGEDENRRHFQWGIGPGIDYQCTDETIGTINYLHRSSEEYGHHNQHILEFGVAHQIADNQHIKLAVDVGLDGAEETPNFATKLQWSIEW